MRTFLLGAIIGAVVTFAGVRAKQRRAALAADAAINDEIARLVDALDADGFCICGKPDGPGTLDSATATAPTGAPAPMDDTLAMAHLMTRLALGPRRRADVLPH
jgi:hypothetical protein